MRTLSMTDMQRSPNNKISVNGNLLLDNRPSFFTSLNTPVWNDWRNAEMSISDVMFSNTSEILNLNLGWRLVKSVSMEPTGLAEGIIAEHYFLHAYEEAHYTLLGVRYLTIHGTTPLMVFNRSLTYLRVTSRLRLGGVMDAKQIIVRNFVEDIPNQDTLAEVIHNLPDLRVTESHADDSRSAFDYASLLANLVRVRNSDSNTILNTIMRYPGDQRIYPWDYFSALFADSYWRNDNEILNITESTPFDSFVPPPLSQATYQNFIINPQSYRKIAEVIYADIELTDFSYRVRVNNANLVSHHEVIRLTDRYASFCKRPTAFTPTTLTSLLVDKARAYPIHVVVVTVTKTHLDECVITYADQNGTIIDAVYLDLFLMTLFSYNLAVDLGRDASGWL